MTEYFDITSLSVTPAKAGVHADAGLIVQECPRLGFLHKLFRRNDEKIQKSPVIPAKAGIHVDVAPLLPPLRRGLRSATLTPGRGNRRRREEENGVRPGEHDRAGTGGGGSEESV